VIHLSREMRLISALCIYAFCLLTDDHQVLSSLLARVKGGVAELAKRCNPTRRGRTDDVPLIHCSIVDRSIGQLLKRSIKFTILWAGVMGNVDGPISHVSFSFK
jgi:hypothetical protein